MFRARKIVTMCLEKNLEVHSEGQSTSLMSAGTQQIDIIETPNERMRPTKKRKTIPVVPHQRSSSLSSSSSSSSSCSSSISSSSTSSSQESKRPPSVSILQEPNLNIQEQQKQDVNTEKTTRKRQRAEGQWKEIEVQMKLEAVC